MLIDLCPICGSDVSHFYDEAGNLILDENGVSLWVCEYPWLHPATEPTNEPSED